MNKPTAAQAIVPHALPLVPFEGWSLETLEQAALAAGYRPEDAVRVFPGGAVDAVETLAAMGDAWMLQALAERDLASLRVPERIALAVRTRIGFHAPHREAQRRALALLALPVHAHRGLACLYKTVDEIWRAAGDASTDFNFYTKRATLAGVYAATQLYWLNDTSEGSRESWEFLDRRLADVAAFGKWRRGLFQRRA